MYNDYTDYLCHGLFNSDGSKKQHKYIERIKTGAKTWKYFYDIGAYNAFKRSKEERAQIKQNRYDREHDTQAYRIRKQKKAYEKAAEAKAADEAAKQQVRNDIYNERILPKKQRKAREEGMAAEAEAKTKAMNQRKFERKQEYISKNDPHFVEGRAKAAEQESKKNGIVSYTIDRLKNELGDREKLKKDMNDNPEKYRERYKNAQKKSRACELELSKFLTDNPDIVEKLDFNTDKGDLVTINTWFETTPELETKIKQLSKICERLNSTQIESATYYELDKQINDNTSDGLISDMVVPLTLVVKVPLENGGFTYTLYKDATIRPFKDVGSKNQTNAENTSSSGTPSRPRSRKKSVTNESGLTVYRR